MRLKGILAVFLILPLSAEFPSKIGKIYGSPSMMDVYEVASLTNLLMESILGKDLMTLENHIHEEEGIYVDIKAKWTKNQFLQDINKRNGYINQYYYKQSPSVFYILKKTPHFIYHFFFEENECQVQIEFEKNPEDQYNIHNPIFKKVQGKWYLLRLI